MADNYPLTIYEVPDLSWLWEAPGLKNLVGAIVDSIHQDGLKLQADCDIIEVKGDSDASGLPTATGQHLVDILPSLSG